MRGPNLTDEERHMIVCTLFESTLNSKPKHGLINELAVKYQVNRSTIFRVWTKAKKQREEGIHVNVNSRLPGKKGNYIIPFPRDLIKSKRLSERSTVSKLSKAINYSESTVYRWKKKGYIRSHTSAVHPDLTADNKLLRLHFVMGKLYLDVILKKIMFKDHNSFIHGDEKWFNMSKTTQRYYLVEDENIPYRSCKSKRFIVKIMFLTAVSRPTYKENGELLFDGKIGIFPFTFKEPAKRNSRNRVRGTMVTKPIESVNRAVMKDYYINKLIPAIKMKWPQTASKNITIQQDNARPHISGNDPDFLAAATSDGFNIQLKQQPANSPDLNVLDLGFFRSISSLQDSKPCTTVEELVKNVQDAFENQEVEKLDNVWLSLQSVMLEIMKCKGHNNYKLQHLHKAAQRRQGTLERDLSVDEDLVEECLTFLNRMGGTYDLDAIFLSLGMQNPF